jgi:hypothetical protein
VRRFVPDFAEIVKPLQHMIKKDVQFKWTYIEKEAFEKIKASISTSPASKSRFHQRLFVVHICFRSFSCSSAHSKGSTRE